MRRPASTGGQPRRCRTSASRRKETRRCWPRGLSSTSSSCFLWCCRSSAPVTQTATSIQAGLARVGDYTRGVPVARLATLPPSRDALRRGLRRGWQARVELDRRPEGRAGSAPRPARARTSRWCRGRRTTPSGRSGSPSSSSTRTRRRSTGRGRTCGSSQVARFAADRFDRGARSSRSGFRASRRRPPAASRRSTSRGSGSHSPARTRSWSPSPNGAEIQGIANLKVATRPQAPAVGDRAIPSRTPTLASAHGDAALVTTASPPDLSLLRYSVADSLAAHAPFVLVFATPKYCTVRTCGPVVDVAQAVQKRFAGTGVRFIHVEIYQDNNPAQGYNRWFKEWRLPSEPFVFLVGRRRADQGPLRGLGVRRRAQRGRPARPVVR